MDKLTSVQRKAFVTGWPIEHSRSPLIHGYWLQKYGIEGAYEKIANSENDIKNFLTDLEAKQYVGGNVTIPHKETALQIVTHASNKAKRLGAVNTVWLEDGQLHGDNTDGYGFTANLDDQAADWASEENRLRGALVLGAGGAARAIIGGLIDRGFSKIWIANRTFQKAEILANQFGGPCMPLDITDVREADTCAVIVNTTSVGMGDGKSPIDLKQFQRISIVNDIVYVPLITPMIEQAQMLGVTAVDGLGMLLHQAVPGFEKWFGVRPEVTQELRNILLRDLGEL